MLKHSFYDINGSIHYKKVFLHKLYWYLSINFYQFHMILATEETMAVVEMCWVRCSVFFYFFICRSVVCHTGFIRHLL